MISDFSEDKNTNDNSMSLTKIKRDQFLVDIRKQKSQAIINEKRLKHSQGSTTASMNPFLNPTLVAREISNDLVLGEDNIESQKMTEIEYQLKLKYDEFYKAYNTENWEDLVMIIQILREAVGIKNAYVTPQTIIAMGIVPNVLDLLGDKFHKISRLQTEAAWLIANVASGDTEVTIALVEYNTVPILCDCLKSINTELQENAMWAISNIAGESFYDFRNLILDAGVLKDISDQFGRTIKKPSYYKTATWLLYNLLKRPTPHFDKVSGTVNILSQLITYPDKEVHKNVLQCLLLISDLDDFARFDLIKAFNLIPKIVNFIQHEDSGMALIALKIAGNLSLGKSHILMELVQSDILHVLPKVLQHKEAPLRKEACFTLCNIIGDKAPGHDTVLDNTIMPIVLDIMKTDTLEIRYEATACVHFFLLHCLVDEAQLLVSKDLIEALVENLTEKNYGKLLSESLKALYRLLALGEDLKSGYEGTNPYAWRIMDNKWLQYIEELQYHNEKDVFNQVSRLLDDFFPYETKS